MPFLGDADVAVKQVDDTSWELLAPLTYQGKRDTFVVPAGQRTDFASVPRVLVWFLPRYGKYTKAAILHDYLWRELACTGTIRWVDADGIFRRAMRELGVAFLKRWMMWTAVRFAAFTKKDGRAGWYEEIWAAALVALLAIPIVLPPALVIFVVLIVFYVVERLAWIPIAIAARFKAPAERKQVNAPSIRMSL
jgi:hypothetical protein